MWGKGGGKSKNLKKVKLKLWEVKERKKTLQYCTVFEISTEGMKYQQGERIKKVFELYLCLCLHHVSLDVDTCIFVCFYVSPMLVQLVQTSPHCHNVVLTCKSAGLSVSFEVAGYARKIGGHKLKIAYRGCFPLISFNL